jgi:hypothetical protein
MPTCFYLFSVEINFWNFGAKVPFLGSGALFSPFLTLKSVVFLTPCKIPDRWICHTIILLLASYSVFGLWRLIFAFWPPKVRFILLYIIFPIDGYITRPYWFWVRFSVFGSRGSFSPFWPLKVYFFLLHVKFPIDGYIPRPYLFWAPNSVFGIWGPIFDLLTPNSLYFLHLYKISDRLMNYFIFPA